MPLASSPFFNRLWAPDAPCVTDGVPVTPLSRFVTCVTRSYLYGLERWILFIATSCTSIVCVCVCVSFLLLRSFSQTKKVGYRGFPCPLHLSSTLNAERVNSMEMAHSSGAQVWPPGISGPVLGEVLPWEVPLLSLVNGPGEFVLPGKQNYLSGISFPKRDCYLERVTKSWTCYGPPHGG